MNTRKKILAITLASLIALTPQKVNAGPFIALFGAIGLYTGVLAGIGYSIYKRCQPIPLKELIGSSKDQLNQLTNKYSSSLTKLEQINQNKTVDDVKQLTTSVHRLASTKSKCMTMLNRDIKKTIKISSDLNKRRKKLGSKNTPRCSRKLAENKFKNLADCKQLEKLIQESETLLDKLKNLQSYIKHATNLL